MTTLSDQPLITVGIPVRNNAKTLDLAVRSILAQTYGEIEVLLIDDGSTDGTLDVMHGFDDPRVRVFSDGVARGLPARRNQAVDLASGELHACMDGDDIAYPRRFERQVDRLRADDQPDLVGTGLLVFQDDYRSIGARRPPADHAGITRHPASGFPMANPTLMGRIDFFRRWPTRPGSLAMDQDMLLWAHRHSRYANLPELLLGYRESRLSMSKILRSRRQMAVGFSRELLRQGSPLLAAQAVTGQVARLALDTAAIGLRLDYRLLRHRALPTTPDEIDAWQMVLAGLGVPAAGVPDGEGPASPVI